MVVVGTAVVVVVVVVDVVVVEDGVVFLVCAKLDFNEATYSNAPQWAPSSPPIPDGFLDVFPLIVLPTPG